MTKRTNANLSGLAERLTTKITVLQLLLHIVDALQCHFLSHLLLEKVLDLLYKIKKELIHSIMK